MTTWGNFFVAEVSASAALAGLIFVGISLNLTKILSFSVLPNRGGQALMLLVNVVLVSSMMLIPDQPPVARGVEVLAGGLILWWAITAIDLRSRKEVPADHRRPVIANLVLNQVATLMYVAAGVLLLVLGDAALIALVPAIFFSVIKAMSDAWVLLVEINR
jgi:modulator of FtsH protease